MRSPLIALLLFAAISPALAQVPPNLGSAASFAVLGGTRVTSSGNTIIAGNVGGSLTGVPLKFVIGDPRGNDTLAQQAQKDRAAAYTALAITPCTTLSGDLRHPRLGRELGPDVYCVPQDAVLTGSLVLNAHGIADAVWIFEITGSLTTAPGSTVQTVEEGRDNNVYWRVSGSATLGAKSVFAGNVLAAGNISVDTTGTVSGRLLTPAAVSLKDAGVTICCALLDMAPHVLPAGTAGTDYNQTLTPKGGNGSYKFGLAASDLSSGVSLTEQGSLTVRQPAAGVYKLAIAISDSTGISCIRVYRLVICGPITLSPPTIGPVACVPFNQKIIATGGTPPYTFASTPLPDGLHLVQTGDASADLFGTATIPGPYAFTVTAADVFGCTGSQQYTGTISSGFTLFPQAGALPEGVVGQDYSADFEVTGGSGNYTFTFSGTIPPGLLPRPGTLPPSSSPKQTLADKPTTGGCYHFTVTVTTDACTVAASNDYTLVIRPVPVLFTPDEKVLPPAAICNWYCQQFSVSACTGTYVFDEIPAGKLPPGLTFDQQTGKLCGTPSAPRVYEFTLSARDEGGHTASHDYSLEVRGLDIGVDPELPPATACVDYEQQVKANGCGTDCMFEPIDPLPSDLHLSTTGLLHGTPTVPGVYRFNIKVKPKDCPDGVPAVLHLVILCNVTLAPPQLPNGRLGLSYSRTLTASCGTPPYTFTLVAGALPPGIPPLSPAGTISGIPTALGCYNFRIRATDSATPPCISEQTYVICIVPVSAQAAPALSGWGMIILTLLLIGCGFIVARRLQ